MGATRVTELIVGLRDGPGRDTADPGGTRRVQGALRRAVLDVFDRPVLGRCQLHKIRNVQDQLPDELHSVVATRMRQA